MRFKAVSEIGKVRSTNEDNYFIDEKNRFFMVADGMGGHAAGDVASKIAVDVSKSYTFDSDRPIESMEELINKANDKIIEKSGKDSRYSGMGTTFASVLIKKMTIYFSNLGDSRIYLYHSSTHNLEKISKDHSLVGQMYREGKLTEDQAFEHPQKNILTQALGLDKDIEIDSGKTKFEENDLILLCTDGLSDLIRRKEMSMILKENDNIDQSSAKLLERALKNGGSDNITFIIIKPNNV